MDLPMTLEQGCTQRQPVGDGADKASLELGSDHFRHLAEELGSEDRAQQAASFGARSITAAEAQQMGFTLKGPDGKRHSSGGIFFPFGQAFGQLRCDTPPLRAKDAEPAKYLNRGRVAHEVAIFGDGQPAIATEGWKDALRLHLETGQTVAAIPGVTSWKLLPESVRLLIYDADAVANPSVWQQLIRAGLERRQLRLAFFPADVAGAKGGACEYFRNGGTYQQIQQHKARALLLSLPQRWKDTEVRIDWLNRSLNGLLAMAYSLGDLNTAELDRLAKQACNALGTSVHFGRQVLTQLNGQRHLTQLSAKADAAGISLEELQDTQCPEEPTRRQLQRFLARAYDIRWNDLQRFVELNGKAMEQIDLADAFLADTHGLEVGKDIARSTFAYLAKRNAYNPVAHYLEGLKAKASELRLISIEELGQAFGIADDDWLSREVLGRHLAGAVRRGIQPGYKHDQILILRGLQGFLKSSSIKALAPDWYDAVTDVRGLEDREFLAKVNSSWVFEFEEVEHALSRRTAPEFKGFITRARDNYVEKYETRSTDHPRRAALFGTTNDHEILNDHTGDRRVWLVDVVKPCDPAWIEQHRDSIWATVCTWLNWGLETYMPQDSLTATAASNRAKQARLSDPWEGAVRQVLEDLGAGKAQATGIGQDELIRQALGALTVAVDRNVQMRITRLVAGAGFLTHEAKDGTALRWVQAKRRYPIGDGRPGQPRSGFVAVPTQTVPTVPTVPTSTAGGWNAQTPWDNSDLKGVFQPFQPFKEVEVLEERHIPTSPSGGYGYVSSGESCIGGTRLERLERSPKTQASTGLDAFQRGLEHPAQKDGTAPASSTALERTGPSVPEPLVNAQVATVSTWVSAAVDGLNDQGITPDAGNVYGVIKSWRRAPAISRSQVKTALAQTGPAPMPLELKF
jgi:predicted P-loop ATPase